MRAIYFTLSGLIVLSLSCSKEGGSSSGSSSPATKSSLANPGKDRSNKDPNSKTQVRHHVEVQVQGAQGSVAIYMGNKIVKTVTKDGSFELQAPEGAQSYSVTGVPSIKDFRCSTEGGNGKFSQSKANIFLRTKLSDI